MADIVLNAINKVHRRPIRGVRINEIDDTDSIFIHNAEGESSLTIDPITVTTGMGTTFDEAYRVTATIYMPQNNFEQFASDLEYLSKARKGCNVEVMLGDMSGFSSNYNAGATNNNYEGGALLSLLDTTTERWSISLRYESPEQRQRLIVTCSTICTIGNILFNGTL